ncbi:MAG TPA: DoxX family protein [Abditibacteriaceae bacterium]|nr:DoxX family protein [Abditibacteriaceae bacterium]
MQRMFPYFISGPGAVGLLVLRLVVGAAFMFHGWDKIRNPFAWMDRPGQPPSTTPDILQALAALSEFGGGLALILGLLTPLAAFGIACTMIVAITTVSLPANQPFVAKGGGRSYELPLTFLAVMIMLMLVGPGSLSLDALIFGRNRRVPDDRLKMGQDGAGL